MSDITFLSADYSEIRHRCSLLMGKVYKKLNSEDIQTCGSELGVWRNNKLALDNDDNKTLFIDYCVFAYRPNGFNMAEKFLRFCHQEADESELELLRYMRDAHYSMYQVEETSGVDTFNVVDIYSKAQYKISANTMAKSTHKGQIMAGYLIDFDGFSIQTGGTVIMSKEIIGSEAMKATIAYMADAYPGDFLRNPGIGARLAKQIVASALRLGNPSNVVCVEF